MKIKPIGSRVLLELNEEPHTFAGGMLVIARTPDKEGYHKIFPQRGTVLAIGPDVHDLEVGDEVICSKYNGVRLPKMDWDWQNLMLILEEHVIVTIIDPKDVNYGKIWGDRSPRNR